MKLTQPEFEHDADADEGSVRPAPARPERRRVHISLVVTLAVLIATVVTIYVVFPKRIGTLREAALELHDDFGEIELDKPSQPELEAWSVGLVGAAVPWPSLEGKILAAKRTNVPRRLAAAVRYRIDGDPVTLIAARAIDAPPRTLRKERDGVFCVSYRRGHWTLVAAGPSATASRWLYALGAPGGKAP